METSISKKIAVATDDHIKVAGHVGRCKAFIVFEIENNNIKSKVIRNNSFTNHNNRDHNHNEEHHHGEGHGHVHHNLVNGLKDCEAIIFSHGGWRLIEDLKANNISPVLTDELFAEDAVKKYLEGKLEIKDENVCQGHHH